MNRNNLAIDYSGLDNISYDVRSMAEDIAVSIKIPDSVVKIPSKYNKQDRLQAVSIFMVVGKVRETARLCGMPYDTLAGWVRSEWWEDCINQAQQINSHIINARTSKIINMAFDSVEKRLKSGEYATYDAKNQEIIYKPVSAKDSAVIFGVMFDKQRINNSLATHITTTTTTHLLDIKAQFESMTNKPAIDVDTVERIE